MKARVKLFGTENTIIRPVLIMMIKDVISNLGGDRDAYVFIDDNSNLLKGHNKTKMSFKSSRDAALKKFNGALKEFARLTDYEDVLDDNAGNDLNFLRPDAIPIFIDKEIKFSVVPIKQRRKVTLGIEYSTQDKTDLIAKCNMMSLNTVYPGITYYHDLEYSYVLPKTIVYMLSNIITCKNKALKELNRELINPFDYIASIADDRLTYTSPDNGDPKDAMFSIVERQASVVGNFTGSVSDIKPEVNEDGGYSINVSYTFTYDEVIGFEINYPIVVYNTMINKLFITKNKTVVKSRVNLHDPMQGALINSVNQTDIVGSPYFKLDYLTIPFYDDMMPRNYPDCYNRVITSLICLDHKDRKHIRNISKMETISFKPEILKLMLNEEREHVTRYKGSFVYLGLYVNDMLDISIPLKLDESGNVYSEVDLDLTKTYRLGIFLLNNYNYLSEEDLRRLKLVLSNNLYTMSDLTKEAIKNYEYLNAHLLESNKNEYYMGITNIKNQFVACIDSLSDTYMLSDKDKELIANSYPDPVGMFFKIVNKEPGYGDGRTTQIYSANLNRLLDYKPKKD